MSRRKHKSSSQRRHRRKSYSSDEENSEEETDVTSQQTDESCKKHRSRKSNHSKSRNKRRRSTEDESSPRERRTRRDKRRTKERKSSDRDEVAKINPNRMVVIPSPSVDQFEHLVSITTDTSELPPQQIVPARCMGSSRNKSEVERSSSKRKSKPKYSPRGKHKSNKSKPRKSRNHHVRSTAELPCCPLCSTEYDYPILLNCAHTFCKECVTNLVEKSDGKSFTCPVCVTRIELKGEDEELFCPNFIILKEIEADRDDEDDVFCTVCEEDEDAAYVCENCSDLLCEDCADAHKIVKYTKEHVVKKIKSDTDVSRFTKKKYFCAKHEDEVLDAYCTKCQHSVCRQCILRYHHGSGHRCIPIEEAVKLNREEIRRESYKLKGFMPNLNLGLLDIKETKKTLKRQVSVVREEISTSIKRLFQKLKEKERSLYQTVNQVYKSKVNKLNAKKGKILIELERFNVANNVLNQLERHSNDVELLQMKLTLENALCKLEKGQKNLEIDKETFLLKSNEQGINNEILKHGELFRVEDTCDRFTPTRLCKTSKVAKMPLPKTYAVLISDFEDTSPINGKKQLKEILKTASDISIAKNLRARSNWMIVRSRVKDIIKYGVIRGYDVKRPRKTTSSEVFSNRLRRSKAKTLKAQAHWLVIKSRLPDVIKNKPPPKRAKPRIRSLDVIETWHSRSNKVVNAKKMRIKAIKGRANANWLLIRSCIRDIVDYGRVTGKIPFGVFQLLSPAMYRRTRESRTILKLKRLRAICMRARANWLLVKSRLSDVVRYNKTKAVVTKPKTWSDYRKSLLSNRDKAARNKKLAGSIRAQANWLIVRTRIPDIILYNMYRQYEKHQGGEEIQKKGRRATSPFKKARFDWDAWDEIAGSAKRGVTSKETEGKTSLKNWDMIVSNTKTLSKSKSVGALNQSSQEAGVCRNWKELVDGQIREVPFRKNTETVRRFMSKSTETVNSSGTQNTTSPKKNWQNVINSLKKSTKGKQKDWENVSNVSSTTKESKEALHHWDILIKSTSITQSKSKTKRPFKTKREEMTMKNHDKIAEKFWDILISGTDSSKEKIDKDQKRINHHKGGTDPWHKVRISLGKGQDQSSVEEVEKKWDRLIKSTKGRKEKAPKIKNTANKKPIRVTKTKHKKNTKNDAAEAFKNWQKLLAGIDVDHDMNALRDWDDLIGSVEWNSDESFDREVSHSNGVVKASNQHWNDLINDVGSDVVDVGIVDSDTNSDGKDDEVMNNWEELITNTTAPTSKEKSKQRKLEKEALKNWDKLVEGRIVRKKTDRNFDVLVAVDRPVKSPVPSKTSQSSVKSSVFKNWHKLITKTPPLPKKKEPEQVEEDAYKNWMEIISESGGNRDNLAFDNWDTLLRNASFSQSISKPHGFNKLYEKEANKPHDNKVLSLNIRNSKGEFHNVNLKLSSPDKSILSAHVAENNDGTFTIFCCPRIDNDFNMFVSLSGEQFKQEIKVVNFYGSFAGLRKNEADLACRTISLLRWHLTPGLLTKKGNKVVARKGSIK